MREKKGEQGRQRSGGRGERIPRRLCADSTDMGLEPIDCEIMT